MFKAKQMLLVLMLGIPAIASAGSPYEAAHERHVTIIKQVHYDRDRSPVRHYDGWGDGEINRMQYMQQKQIQRGVRSGALTRSEARRLWDEQERIARLERRYKADGHLSLAERRDLERDLNRAGRRIYNQANDRQARG